MKRHQFWLAVAVLAALPMALPGTADASECIAGCKVPFTACAESVRGERSQCRTDCRELAPGPERGQCLRGCALSVVDGFGVCRSDLMTCRDTCVAAPIACRAECVPAAQECRTTALDDAALCRATCSADAMALYEECVVAGGDRETCREQASDLKSMCLDTCGVSQSMALESCGATFEQCIVECTPPDADEETEQPEEEVEEEEEEVEVENAISRRGRSRMNHWIQAIGR